MVDSKKEKQAIKNAILGEFNRMCVTHDLKELHDMFICAKVNITKLYRLNEVRIQEE